MVEVKDKIVTVESLSALHEYNKNSYETKDNVEKLNERISENINENVEELNERMSEVEDRVTPIANGGTNSSNGATGLANLFASGNTILSPYQYGDELPEAGNVGRIFFKRLTDI